MFRVGQSVVCVSPVNDLKKGVVYTVLACGAGYRGKPMINVDQSRFGSEDGMPAFYASRFRPVVDRKTDISIFTEILHKINTREDA